MPLDGDKQLRERLADFAGTAGRLRATPVEPTFAQRYECKYLVHGLLIPEIRNYLRPFVQPDSFAARRAEHRYSVGSLYLDSRDLLLHRQTQAGEKDRFKLRVRTYGDNPRDPAYFEVKRKVNCIVHKRRAGLTREQAHELLANRTAAVLSALSGRKLGDLEHFLHHSSAIGARPVMRVKYRREAYEATGHEPVRVTIDTDLEHAISTDGDLRHGGTGWAPTPLDGTILEIKFTERFPWWLEEFVRNFGLRQRSVPKYVLSIEDALRNGGRAALASGGFEPPPNWN